MKIKVKELTNLIFAFILFVVLVSCGSGKGDVQKIEFSYQQGTEKDYKSYMYYYDDYFNEPSTSYNPSLATASLCMAMASFASNNNKNYKDYSERYRNIYSLMGKIDLKDIEVNEWYTKKPTTDSLGAIFGHKKIGEKELIVVGIRGANYESEWASNCTVGNSIVHQGFYDSATIMLDDLKAYLKRNNIKGNIAIWSSGYSRASAVNNMACARIDRAISKNENFFGSSISIKKEDLYSYCFEVPMGASFLEDISPRSDIYNNIFNIINRNDIVTKVTPQDLGFTRYGVDHFLPISNLTSNYSAILKEVLSFYEKMDNYDVLGEYKISKFNFKPLNIVNSTDSKKNLKANWTQNLYLDEFISSLATYGIKDIDNYVENIQIGLRDIFYLIYGNVPPKYSFQTFFIGLARNLVLNGDIDYIIMELIRNPNDFAINILPYIVSALSDLEIDIDSKEFAKGIRGLLDALANTFANNLGLIMPLISIENIKGIASAHYPELCLAHMMAQDSNYTSSPIKYDSSGAYYLINTKYSEELSLEIYCDDELVAKVVDGNVIEIGTYSYGKVDLDFVAYLPVGKNYKIVSNESIEVFEFDQTKQYLKNVLLEVIDNNYIF